MTYPKMSEVRLVAVQTVDTSSLCDIGRNSTDEGNNGVLEDGNPLFLKQKEVRNL